jgi:flagellar biosynthesis/type III secretory pathway chaperone
MKKEEKELFYYRVTDIWRRLCEEHNNLLDQTCEEYALLLASKLDELEAKIDEKKETLARIGSLEKLRAEIIEAINKKGEMKIESVTQLIEVMQEFENENNQMHLFRFNALLIDMIEKMQTQNKRNQLFINKALLNLKSIREEALGEKSYSTYTKKGQSSSRPLEHR